MNKKILAVLMAFVIIPFSLTGCVKLVDENSGNSNGSGKYDDAFIGIMLTLYERGENSFIPVTSTTYGDENCIAQYVGYSNESGGDWYTCSASGHNYLSGEGGGYCYTNINQYASTRFCSLNDVVYCNPTYFNNESIFFSFDKLSLDEKGEIVREEGTVIESQGHWNWDHSVTYETNQTVTHTETVNGNSEEITETFQFSVTLTLKPREAVNEYRIIQYNNDGVMLENTSVTKEDAGDFEVKDDCAFVIAEEILKSGEVRRTMSDKNDDKWGEIEFCFDGDFGILAKTKFKLVNHKD